MKALVVFYSRTGMTRKIADAISSSLKCDVEELVDTKDRSGVLGYIMAGKDAASGALTKIREPKNNPGSYDIVIMGTPVWAFNASCPVRTYIFQNKDNLKNIAFFCTQGGYGSKGVFRTMENICGKKPKAILELTAKEIVKGEYIPKVNKFLDDILR